MSGHLPDVITGEGGIFVSGGQALTISGTSIETPGDFQRIPTTEITSSIVPALLWSVPFTLLKAGDVLFSMVWNCFMQNIGAPPVGVDMGFLLFADLDGIPLIDVSAVNLVLDPGPSAIVTYLANGTYQSVGLAVDVGPHVLNIFWNTFSAGGDCLAEIAQNQANIQISRL